MTTRQYFFVLAVSLCSFSIFAQNTHLSGDWKGKVRVYKDNASVDCNAEVSLFIDQERDVGFDVNVDPNCSSALGVYATFGVFGAHLEGNKLMFGKDTLGEIHVDRAKIVIPEVNADVELKRNDEVKAIHFLYKDIEGGGKAEGIIK